MTSNLTARKPSPWIYFLLVFLLTIPEYAAGLVAPYSIVMVANPFLAATILTYREKGSDGVKQLVMRSFDFKRITGKTWYLPILLLMPVVMILELAWMSLLRDPAPGLYFPLWMLPVYFLVFFFAAIGEETGWSGYAIDPLQERMDALSASLVIGAVWAAWHIVPYTLANAPLWVAGQCVTTVLLRVLMVWIYNNSGRSVFGMVLFHAMINMATVPDFGFPYDPVFGSVVLAGMASIVVFLWGKRTLACCRSG